MFLAGILVALALVAAACTGTSEPTTTSTPPDATTTPTTQADGTTTSPQTPTEAPGTSSESLDPAVVASPAITTLVDVTGMIIYFGLAKWMLSM